MDNSKRVQIGIYNMAKRKYHARKLASPCWVWGLGLQNCGYGNFRINKKTLLVHRIVYEAFYGKIKEGMDIDHLCRNRACANPLHLEEVTRRENIIRGIGICGKNAQKTHCKHGHSLEDAYINRGGYGRQCRTCSSISNKKKTQNKTN